MGIVHTEITLKNGDDVSDARRGRIKEPEVRQATVTAMVDTGAGTLVISEALCQQLGLAVLGLRRSTLADGSKQIYQVTAPVEVHWKDRETDCRAIVLPDADEVLLGAIPLEDMDLIVHPKRQELTGAHGDEVLCMIKELLS